MHYLKLMSVSILYRHARRLDEIGIKIVADETASDEALRLESSGFTIIESRPIGTSFEGFLPTGAVAH